MKRKSEKKEGKQSFVNEVGEEEIKKERLSCGACLIDQMNSFSNNSYLDDDTVVLNNV